MGRFPFGCCSEVGQMPPCARSEPFTPARFAASKQIAPSAVRPRCPNDAILHRNVAYRSGVEAENMVRHPPVEIAAHQRVMAGHNQVGPAGQAMQRAKPVQHVLHVHHDGKGFFSDKVLVEMRRIRGQHHPARLGSHPDRLQTATVPANAMHAETLGNLGRSVVKNHLAGIQPLDRLTNVPCRERHPQRVVAHARARGIGHLGSLQMQLGIGKQMQATGMIIVQMGHDDFGHVFGIEVKGL
mmetsp:Transcript_28784/g.54672  ORF Transcript_28784/g.54672 Transcript_28784/m.54672 type:complete len:241 (-) Transcript_28784:1732-2454(-)